MARVCRTSWIVPFDITFLVRFILAVSGNGMRPQTAIIFNLAGVRPQQPAPGTWMEVLGSLKKSDLLPIAASWEKGS